MKKTLSHQLFTLSLIIGLLLCVNQTATAQYLEVKNTETGKIRKIKAKQSFNFKYSAEDEYKKGKIQSFTDSSLVIFTPEEDDAQLREVKLKDIYSIKKLSCLHKTGYVIGGLFIAGGAVTVFEAPGIAGDDGSDWLVRGIGLATVAVGVIPYLIKPKEFVQGKNAEYKIVVSGQ